MQSLRDEVAAAIYKPSHCMTLDDCRVQADAAIAVFKGWLESEAVIEALLHKTAIHIYHENGLETMSYLGEDDFSTRERHHYKPQVLASVSAIINQLERKK